MKTGLRPNCLVMLLLFSAGCAHEFEIRTPASAGHVGQKAENVFTITPIEYHARAVDSRLVLRLFNSTDESIALLGSKSVVVDPTGQSRPLPDQTIAAHSFAKLILPPIRPTVEQSNPTIGLGLYGGFGYNTATDANPQYFVVLNSDDYWDWPNDAQVRLTLVYQVGSEIVSHPLVIQKVKAK